MSAQNNLNPKFYHGTPAELEPGDVIHPSGDSGYKRFAYASTTVRHARTFGPNVYKVEPVGDYSGPRPMERYDNEPRMDEVISTEGFRVVNRQGK